MNKKTNPDKDTNDIKINVGGSSLAEFTKRDLPTEKEVEEFEDYIEEENGEAENEEMDEEIEDSLNEIYQDENGHQVDVRKFEILKRRGLFFWLFAVIFSFGIIGASVYGIYQYYYLRSGTDPTAVDFSIDGKTEVLAGEEFFYTINYTNTSNVQFRDAEVDVNFPENFIILDSFPLPSAEKKNFWQFSTIPPKHNGKIKIKGKMIGEKSASGLVSANIRYMPANFSSEFKKDASFSTKIADIGVDIEFDYLKSVLVGEENEVLLRLKAKDQTFINNFRLSLEPQENVEVIGVGKLGEEEKKVDYSDIRPGVWQINEVASEEKLLPIKFVFSDKSADKQELVFNFDLAGDGGKEYLFLTKKLDFEVMKSDLNLTLIVDGSREDQGIDFGQTLNYSIVYNNKGETDMQEVVIQAVLNSDYLDWTTLADQFKGREKGNTITWTKEEIPELEVVEQNEEGTIDFSIKVLSINAVEPGKNYQVESYALFSVGEINEGKKEGEDNRSNTITNKINSDLELKETLRYFNEDNIPVGTGPHPPKVGETTSYKAYWSITNNLHELDNVAVSVKLPAYVSWDDKAQVSVGSIQYIGESHTVVWNVGRLPLTVFQANGEFSISITPGESDKNKIMVLLPGSEVQAVDSETKAKLISSTKAKTTKLEDDDIAGGDGIVE